jgi:hypothetical protein
MIGAKQFLYEIKLREENHPNTGKKPLLGFDYLTEEEGD